jgi:hypothetical protein
MGLLRILMSRLWRSTSQPEASNSGAADYVPQVSRDDVLRVVRRDVAAEDSDAVLAALDQYGMESWHSERHRVHLAILKLSCGNIGQIRHYVEVACRDFRDVIVPAEYPRFSEVWLRRRRSHDYQ